MKKFIAAAFAFSSLTAPLFADPAVAAKSAAADTRAAVESYNEAVQKFSSYGEMVYISASEISANLHETEVLRKKSDSISNELTSHFLALAKLDDNFKIALASVSTYTELVGELKKSQPLGEKKIKFIRELIDKGAALVEKDPGGDYQDKRYFDSVSAGFKLAVSVSSAARAELEKSAVLAAVAKPRIEGIAGTLASAKEYAGKANFSQDGNKKIFEGVGSAAEKFAEEWLESYKLYNGLYSKLTLSNAEVVKTVGALSNLILNDFPNSEKYAQTRFGRLDIPNISRAEKSEFSLGVVEISDMKFEKISLPATLSARGEDAAKSKSGYWRRAGAANESLSEDVADVNSAKRVRAEILEICAQISSATEELNVSSAAVNNAVACAQTASSALADVESCARAALEKSIAVFGETQSLMAKIKIRAAGNAVYAQQKKIGDSEMSALDKSCEELMGKSAEFSASALKNIDAAAKELE